MHEVMPLPDFGVLVLEATSDAVILLDKQWRFQLVNRVARQLLKRDDLIGRSFHKEFPQARKSTYEKHCRMALSTRRTVCFVEYFEPLDVWTEVRVFPTDDGLAIFFRDIDDRTRLEEQLRDAALVDDLTGLPTRLALLDLLGREMDVAPRYPSLEIVYLGIAGLREINGTLGLDVGDAVIAEMARRLSEVALATGHLVARVGGGDFVVIVPRRSSVTATEAIRLMRYELSQPVQTSGLELPVPVSMGLIRASCPDELPSNLLRDGHTAMHASKLDGPNRTRVFVPAMREAAEDRLSMLADLSQAIPRDELRLHYQPVVNLSTGRIVGVEALVRWQHPRRGLLYPAEFLHLLIETGLSVPLGRWVIGEATRACVEWLETGTPLTVSVNITTAHLACGTLHDDVETALEVSGLSADRLALELTETDLVVDLEGAAYQLTSLRDLGVRVAVDDFGSGYSSLTQLTQLPADVVKLDRSLVLQLTDESQHTVHVAERLVGAVTSIAEYLGMWTVAEGIENEDQRAAVMAAGCTHGQGFGLARPMPGPAVADFVRQQSAGVPSVRAQSTSVSTRPLRSQRKSAL